MREEEDIELFASKNFRIEANHLPFLDPVRMVITAWGYGGLGL